MTMTPRTATAAVLLAATAGLALLGMYVHYSFVAEYGRAGDTALEGLGWALTAGLSAVVLAIVAVVALLAVVLSPRRWMRLTAAALPVLMLLGMLALTPSALHQKCRTQNEPAAHCLTQDVESNRSST
jgi:putative copper export protein